MHNNVYLHKKMRHITFIKHLHTYIKLIVIIIVQYLIQDEITSIYIYIKLS